MTKDRKQMIKEEILEHQDESKGNEHGTIWTNLINASSVYKLHSMAEANIILFYILSICAGNI